MQETRKIAVAGATGRVGRHVVDVLESEGHDVVAIARATGVDLITGEGLPRPSRASRGCRRGHRAHPDEQDAT